MPDYQPYDYLPPDAYEQFDLDDQTGAPPYPFDLDETQRGRVEALLAGPVISLHEHAYLLPRDVRETSRYFATGRIRNGYAGLARSHLDVVFDNMGGPLTTVAGPAGWKFQDVVVELGLRLADLAHQHRVVPARNLVEVDRARANGQVAIVFGVEAATGIENELDRLDVLYGLGIVQFGLVYGESNQIGTGGNEARDGGLTRFGHQVVRRLNALGALIDVSHASDRTCLDAFEASSAPVLITHAGARALWPTPRMKPDEVIRGCAATGGVIGIEAAPHTTISPAHPRHSLDSVMDHFEYCAELVGLDHVTFGPDTMFGDHVALHRALFAPHRVGPQPTHELVDRVSGMDNPAQNFESVVSWLVVHGYSDPDIAKVIGGNVRRVLERSWPAGHRQGETS